MEKEEKEGKKMEMVDDHARYYRNEPRVLAEDLGTLVGH